VDQPRVEPLELVGPHDPLDRSGSEVGDQHVALAEQIAQQRVTLGRGEVEFHAAFAVVEPDEMCGVAEDSGVVATGEVSNTYALNLHDVRAHLGEVPCAQRRRDRLLDGDHPDPLERACARF
jgi:hypothetical protein